MRIISGLFILVAIVPTLYFRPVVNAFGLTPRTLLQATSAPGATTDYTLTMNISNNITLGSLSILFCANTPIEDDSCDLPNGIDVSGAQLTSQTGITDFSLFNVASNSFLLSRTPGPVTAPQPLSLTFHNIINPSGQGPYYVRVAAYSSNNGTGSSVAYGGLAFAITNNVQVSSVVPPYLTFCSAVTIANFDCSTAAGNYIDFGKLVPAHSSQATSQLLVATNASNGYVMQVYGMTMISGNNVINAISNNAASQPGSSQFGLNLRANSVPAVGADPAGPGTGQPVGAYANPNHFQFVSNDVIGASPNADSYRKYTVSYLVNTTSSQPVGVYASTLTYVAAGSF